MKLRFILYFLSFVRFNIRNKNDLKNNSLAKLELPLHTGYNLRKIHVKIEDKKK